ncbi:MAG: NUDIX hydrolase [Parcubacteria group bacterium GW2011_GWA2_47_9]|nr:MAG: NUDIX hydrolase [Parcubacteria group bacterium GW2011_GWA2_47_9]
MLSPLNLKTVLILKIRLYSNSSILKMRKKFIPAKLYSQITDSVPISCADMVIKRNQSFLLVKRRENPAKNQWWLAGGRIAFGEKMLDTAKRKLKEELNIKSFSKIKPLGTAEIIFPENAFGHKEHDIINVFLVELNKKDSSRIKPDKTMYGYQWFLKIEKNFHPHIKKYLGIAGFK